MTTVLMSGTLDGVYGLRGVKPSPRRITVFAAPTQEFHVMHQPESIIEDEDGTVNYEAASFCRRMADCETELLAFSWIPSLEATDQGQELIDSRQIFLSATSVQRSFLTAAQSMIWAMPVRLGDFTPQAKSRTSDAAQHLLRLCWQGFHLYSTGYLPMTVDEPARFLAFGQRVADGAIDEARGVIEQYRQKFAATKSALPEAPDVSLIDRWLRFVRIKNM